MLDLSSLKIEVIKKLIIRLEQNGPDCDFSSFTFDCPKMDILRLLNFVDAPPITYFKSRNGLTEILGLGYVCKFSESDNHIVEKIINSNSSLIFFSALRFNQEKPIGAEWKNFSEFAYILPMVSWCRQGDKCSLQVNYPNSLRNNPQEKAEFIINLESLLTLSQRYGSLENNIFFSDFMDLPSKKEWDQMVEECLSTLSNSTLDKVVLARKRILNLSSFNPLEFFQKVTLQNENSFSFLIKLNDHHSFFSFTPELLFQIENGIISLDSLAGTRNRGPSTQEDQKLERDLKTSKKDLSEHRIVSREIHEILSEICENITALTRESVLKLKYVQHLHTVFSGKLNQGLSIFEIIKKIHPTPAVGGHPKKMAKGLIDRLENFDRGLYGAPVGIISREKSEMAVGIRSALLFKNQLHIFGGAGIVLGSTPDNEWEETVNKMKNFLV